MLVALYVVMWNVIDLGTFDHAHGELSELGACQLFGQIVVEIHSPRLLLVWA